MNLLDPFLPRDKCPETPMISPHPLYDDEDLVREVSHFHMREGRSVFQLWLVHPSEKWHSRAILDALQIPRFTNILSLACGVGGMERHWAYVRRDLRFDLLNQSKAQLDLCDCPGRLIHESIEGYYPNHTPSQYTMIAYALGHVDARKTLEHMITHTEGPVVALDVFDASPEFDRAFAYNTPTTAMMRDLGFTKVEIKPWKEGLADPWIINPFIEKAGLASLVQQTTPGLWVKDTAK